MEEDKKNLYRRVARLSALGLEMGLAIAIGIFIGHLLDAYFHTRPWLTIIFLLLGIAASFRSLFSLLKRIERDQKGKRINKFQ